MSATEDMAMVAQIKAEVRKLSNRNDIYKSICVLEKEEQTKENIERMIYVPLEPENSPPGSPDGEVSLLWGGKSVMGM